MDRQYTAMIIDDEPEAIAYLSGLINENCKEIKIVTTAAGSKEAIRNYFEFIPDLLFLDILIDDTDGFGILKEIYSHKSKPYVIFITAYEKYALEAFRHDALDYLLKPVDVNDIKNVVKKFIEHQNKDLQYLKINDFISQYQRRIRFNTREGFILLDAKDVLYCEADRNYSKLYLTNGKQEVVSMNLGSLEEKLPTSTFKRISKSYIINIDYLHKADRKKKICQLILEGKEYILPASRDRLLELDVQFWIYIILLHKRIFCSRSINFRLPGTATRRVGFHF